MVDDGLKRVRDRYGRWALKAQAEAAEHIRTCPRCERLFLVAYEATVDQMKVMVFPSKVWLITMELLPEFRQCSSWPKDI
jgi:hypothetical protein